MSKKRVKTKGKTDGTKCPNCGSLSIVGESIESDGATNALRNCSCNDCDATWTELLVTIGYDDLEVPAKKVATA